MNEMERAAYIMAMAACAQIEAAGMTAANQHRLSRGESIAYDEKAFADLLDRYCLHHNQVHSFLQGFGG